MTSQSNSNRPAYFLLGIVCILLIFLIVDFFRSKDADQRTGIKIQLTDKEVLLLLEAAEQIQQKALFSELVKPGTTLFQDSLKSYLARHDPFSDYLTPEEFLRFRQLREEQYVGIGMEIEKDRHGRIVCFPYPGSPAVETGVRPGDHLIQINGIPVQDRSAVSVASLARGRMGDTVNLVVADKNGIQKELRVLCKQLEISQIRKRELKGFAIIEIHGFSHTTALELETILKGWNKAAPVVIDLRGNSGGDLDAAIKSAELFLDKGQRVVSIETRTGTTAKNSRRAALDLLYPVYLWQDATTASAAEVFIAALTDNSQGVSIGKTTFGKGTKQDIIKLSNGSALILTTGRLKTPNGIMYQDRGLDPAYRLKKEFAETADYLLKTKELTQTSFKRSVSFPHIRTRHAAVELTGLNIQGFVMVL